ncbi:hypothetical protein [Stagnimonas aquatica]|uniref:hypothetical protein n=1 Tax=Stagnimonas aquatica TaxID=2689987 RepID=UPI0011CD6803|nr:hypothetical protein [Stagnimonas aquatica]
MSTTCHPQAKPALICAGVKIRTPRLPASRHFFVAGPQVSIFAADSRLNGPVRVLMGVKP